jgi:DNA-binding Xre family transcriptional regulator
MSYKYVSNKALRRIVETKCVSQAKLAAAVGMRTDILSRIIHSKRPIYADEVQPICKALGISVAELLDEEQSA